MTTTRGKPAGNSAAPHDAQHLFNLLEIAVVVTDIDGIISDINDTTAIMFGYSRSDLLGQPFEMLIAKRFRDTDKTLRDATKVEGSGKQDVVAIHKSGREFDVTIGMSAVPTEKGVAITAAILDTSTTKLAEQRAQYSEHRPAEAQSFAHLGHWDWNIATGVLSWSDEIYRLFGLTPQSFSPTYEAFLSRVHPEDRQDVIDAVNQSIRNHTRYRIDHRIILPDGSERLVHEEGEATYDHNGEPLHMIGIVQDMTMHEKTEREFRNILEAAPDGIVLVDQTGTIVLVNAQTELLFGYGREELLNQPVEMLIPDRFRADHPQKRDSFFSKSVTRPMGSKLDLLAKRRDGTELAVEISLAHVQRGAQTLVTAGIRDISERRAAQLKLRESEQRYQALANMSPVGIFRTDARGRCVYVNQRWSEITGITPEQAAGTGWAKALDPRDRKRVAREWENATRRGAPFHSEYRFCLPNGEERWVYGQASRETNGEGQLTGFVGTITDITPLKIADRDIRESDARFRQLVDNINHAFWITDWKKRKLLYVSPAYARIFGRSCESLHANRLSWRELIHPEDHEWVSNAFRQGALLGEATEHEYRILRDDGQVRWVHDAAIPVFDNEGAVDRIIGIAEDITDKKLADQERESLAEQLRHAQKMEAVGTLASGVAHDFNNILTAIMGYAEVAQLSEPDGIISDALNGISRATAQAVDITRSLLTFSRKTSALKTPLQIGHVVEDTVGMLRQMIPSSVTISANVSEATDLWVLVDKTQIQQVVMNLAINARDAMPDGGALTLTVTRRCDVGCEYAVLVVSDTGSGMSPEVMERLFEPFFTTKTRGQGTGLGMAIVHGVIQDHDGDISVKSAPDKGTRITITLPTCLPGKPDHTRETGTLDHLDASGCTVLLAEDNDQIRSVTKAALGKAGFHVIAAASGTEAVSLFDKHRDQIDLLLLDVDLPGRTGISCLNIIRKTRPDLGAVIITGNANFTLEAQSLANVTLLLKPFTPSEVVATLHQTMATAALPISLTHHGRKHL